MATQAAPPPAGVKFSRYRSVRKAAVARTEVPLTPLPPPPQQPSTSLLSSPENEGVTRSMSRYRRNRVPAANASSPPPMPAAASTAIFTQQQANSSRAENPFKTPPRSAHGKRSDRRPHDAGQEPSRQAYADQGVDPFKDSPASSSQTTSSPKKDRSDQVRALTSEDRKELRIRRYEENLRAERAKRLSESDKDMSGREVPERSLAGHHGSSSPVKEEKKRGRPLLHRLSHKPPEPPRPSDVPMSKSSKLQPSPSSHEDINDRNRTENSSKQEVRAIGIEPGGGGIVPGTDAPVSAVNAGERRVTIRYFEKTINLPVTPETTPSDLMRSAANILTDNINPENMVLLESYVKAGLERPIRKYEHIRDVMNSWDRDSVNYLILIPAADDSHTEDLEVSSVSTEQPNDISVLINYSQVPGKWKKQWVTLRSDGQMLVCKKEGSKDVSNVCHLSDFDVYRPTRSQLKKVIKPGKKHCFAVKSQEKSTMFMTASTFVHFFATDDRRLATQWYKAIHSWRSWYLVNALGAGQKPTKRATQLVKTATVKAHAKSKLSVESVPYQIGSFTPLMTTEEFAKTLDTPDENAFSPSLPASPVEKARHHHNVRRRHHSPPPSSFPRKLTKQNDSSNQHHSRNGPRNIVQGQIRDAKEDSTFAPTGLLGRTYSQRQAANRAREESSNEGPFVQGSTLLGTGSPPSDDHSGSHLTHRRSIRSPQRDTASNAHSHPSTSRRQKKPEPLLNFDEPDNWEPPQFRGKGKGFNPDDSAMPTGALVEAATTPATAIQIPPSTQWRRPPPPNGTATGRQAASQPFSRYRSTRDRKADAISPFADPEDDEPLEFTGLLAKSGHGQGGLQTGRGVMSGNRAAGQPMLDMREANKFAPGSLLASVAVGEDNGPIIDREKNYEKDVGVGEST